MASLTWATRSDRPQLLRRDVKVRVRISRGRRELLLAEFDRSGVSAAVFARMAGINYQTFAGWLPVRRRGGRREAGTDRHAEDSVALVCSCPFVP
jgi:hypothetical protein